jgi:hypothetical protein
MRRRLYYATRRSSWPGDDGQYLVLGELTPWTVTVPVSARVLSGVEPVGANELWDLRTSSLDRAARHGGLWEEV